jgi:hypothetical protein
VGATVLAALTGQDPELLPHQGLGIDVPLALRGQVDARLTLVLGAMLRPDPDQRASRILSLLETQRLRLPAGSTPASPPEALRGRSDRSWQPSSGPRAARNAPRTEPDWTRRPPQSQSYQVHHGGEWFFGRWFFRHVLLLPAILLAVEVARLAIWGLFNLFLPTLLTVLSIFFGRPFRRAASTLDRLGTTGREGLRRASRQLQARADQSAAARHAAREQRRVRVASRGQRVSTAGEGSADTGAASEGTEAESHEEAPGAGQTGTISAKPLALAGQGRRRSVLTWSGL